MRLKVGEQVPVSDPSRDLYEIDIYFNLQKQAIAQFGVDTLLLYQMGKFYEVYGREDNEEDERRVAAFAECCNLQDGAHKSTGIPKHRYTSPPRMLGFTDKALDKFRTLLLNAGWTLVIVSESDSEYSTKGKTRTLREITEIVSGATHEDNTQSSYTVCAVYVEPIPSSSSVQYYSAGFVSLSCSTGNVQLEERTETKTHMQDSLYRFLLSNDPSFILVCSDEAHSVWDLSGYRTQVIDLQPDQKKVKWIYDNLLSRAAKMDVKSYHYKERQVIAQRIGLSSEIRSAEALIALGAILKYILQQKPEVVEKIHCNTESQTCVLYGNAMEQLAVLPKKSYVSRAQHIPSARSLTNQKWDSLYSLLDMCETRFGSRLLQYRITHPMVDPEAIRASHDAVGRLIENRHYREIRSRITSSQDGERIVRRVETNWKLSPGLVASLYSFVRTWRGVQRYIEEHSDIESLSCGVARWDALLSHLETHFDIQALSENRASRWEVPIRSDSELAKEIQVRETQWQRRVDCIKQLLGVKSEKSIKVCSNDTDGYTITIPKSKAKAWNREAITNDDPIWLELREAKIKTMASSARLFHPAWRHDWFQRAQLCDRIHQENRLYLQEWVAYVQSEWLEEMEAIVKWASQMDVWCAYAWCSVRYGYHRPTLVETDADSPVVIRGTNLRHPMIERLQEDVAGYVANDVSLDQSQHGMLLYGMNASGKSSYMKSVGLALILSQAGCWVPCEACSHSIVFKLFTRISGNDDYMRGKSSFALEMEELSTILQDADRTSVVLGDELCRGTEQISGTALVGAGVETLMKQGVSFVFATHLHDLPKLSNLSPYIHQKTLGVYHLKVLQDAKSQTLEYERKLQEDQGSTMYGIEVAGALGLHRDTLETAMRLREELMGFQEKRSHYNQQKVIKVCEVCRRNPATETHHILEQHTATRGGIVDGSKRLHGRSNLVGICESCHQKHHHGALSIQGWRETTSGETKLVVKE